jgi:hypothetical protein
MRAIRKEGLTAIILKISRENAAAGPLWNRMKKDTRKEARRSAKPANSAG